MGGGGGARIGAPCAVPRGYMARASHSWSCERGCGDQSSRQKFKLSHLISLLHMKRQRRVAPLWKWSSASDAFRLCSSEIPNVDRVTICMRKHKASLSDGCKAVFDTPEPSSSTQ